MGFLCNIVAALWLLRTANTFVYPNEAIAEELAQDAQTNADWDQLVQPFTDYSPEQPQAHFTLPRIALVPGDDEEISEEQASHDSVEAWLEGVDTGSVLTSTLFPSLTFTSYAESVTSTPSYSHTASPFQPTPTVEAFQTPTSAFLSLQDHSLPASQKPLGVGRVWQTAKIKAASAVHYIGNMLPTCSQQLPAQHITASGHAVYDEAQDGRVWSMSDSSASDGNKHHFSLPDTTPTTSAAASVKVVLDHGATNPTASADSPLITNSANYNTSLNNGDSASSSSRFPTPEFMSHHAVALLVSLLATTIAACIVLWVLYRRNPRRRAERLAAWEECQNRSLYRRARFQHYLNTWRQAVRTRLVWVWPVAVQSRENLEAGLCGGYEKAAAAGTTTMLPPTQCDPPGYDASGSESEGECNGSNASGRRSKRGRHTARLIHEITNFREAHTFISNVIHAEEGQAARWSRREQRRTAMWLFGGRANRQRAGSLSSDSDKSEKSAAGGSSGDTIPPPYEDREKYAKVEESRYAQVEAGMGRVIVREMQAAGHDCSDASSVSSAIPTSPLGTTFTFSAGDVESEKEWTG